MGVILFYTTSFKVDSKKKKKTLHGIFSLKLTNKLTKAEAVELEFDLQIITLAPKMPCCTFPVCANSGGVIESGSFYPLLESS